MLVSALAWSSCQRSAPEPTDPQTALVARGRAIFQGQCTACHNSDPRKPGTIGPDVYGSSRELIEARVLHGSYPPGYKPKRSTHQMALFPHLKGDIDAIHAYLNSEHP